MTLLAPLFFVIALGVAAGAVVLHFIVTRQPASSLLPTVRFVPRGTVRVVTVERPRDVLLLLLRVALILLIGLAFSRPVLVPDRRPVARIVLADVSRAVGSVGEVRDSVLSLLGERDVLVVFDARARVVRAGAADTASGLVRSGQVGRLSPALVAALRAAGELRAEADSVEIAIVSAFRADQVDAATAAVRALWPGRIRLVRVAAGADTLAAARGADVRGPDGGRGAGEEDGVVLAARLAGLAAGDTSVRVVRGAARAEDSVWAAAGARTLVRWPAEGAPPGWHERARPDTAGAVVAGEAVLVYPLERRWEPGAAHAASGRVAARWVDGEPAAVERAVGAGCIRDVAVPVPEHGDVVLRPSFGRLVRALVAPCGALAGVGTGLDEEELRALAGAGPLAARETIAPAEAVTTPLVPWLLALALLLALLELWVRRGGGAGTSSGDVATAGEEAAPERGAGAGDRRGGGAGRSRGVMAGGQERRS